MNASSWVGFAYAAALVATTALALPSQAYAGEGRYVGTHAPVGYARHDDRRGDRRHWDERRDHKYGHSHRHQPVKRYYAVPHHHHYYDYRPYYGPRYYPYGHSGWDIDLHYRFSGR